MLKFIGYILVIACFAFLIKAIVNLTQKQGFNLSLIKSPAATIGYGIFSAVIFAAIVYVSAAAWNKILEFLGDRKISYSEVRNVYVRSNIAKYLPGNVMHFAGRNVLGKKFGFSQFDMALSTVIEVISLLFTACLWSLILAYRSFVNTLSASLKRSPFVLPVIIAAAVIIIAAGVFFAYKKGYLQKFKKLFTLKFLKLFIILFLIYSVTMIIPGILLALIFVQALGISLSLQTCVLVVAAYMISWALGYIVPGAPGGIGIREFALLIILGGPCGQGFTLVAMIIHRIASIIGDVLAFAFEIVFNKITRKG